MQPSASVEFWIAKTNARSSCPDAAGGRVRRRSWDRAHSFLRYKPDKKCIRRNKCRLPPHRAAGFRIFRTLFSFPAPSDQATVGLVFEQLECTKRIQS